MGPEELLFCVKKNGEGTSSQTDVGFLIKKKLYANSITLKLNSASELRDTNKGTCFVVRKVTATVASNLMSISGIFCAAHAISTLLL